MKKDNNTNHSEAKDTPPPAEIKPETVTILKTALEDLQEKAKKADEYLDKMLRGEADTQNLRKRLEKNHAEFLKYANEGIIRALLPVIDDFERANAAALKGEDYALLHKGVEMIMTRLNELLKDYGVVKIEACGKMFDPYQHEAVMHVETAEHEDNIVIEEMQKGYMLENKVIRPAMVKVAKKATKD